MGSQTGSGRKSPAARLPGTSGPPHSRIRSQPQGHSSIVLLNDAEQISVGIFENNEVCTGLVAPRIPPGAQADQPRELSVWRRALRNRRRCHHESILSLYELSQVLGDRPGGLGSRERRGVPSHVEAPSMHVWTQSSPGWEVIMDNLPKHATHPGVAKKV